MNGVIGHLIDYNLLMKHFCCFLLLLLVIQAPAFAGDLTLFGGFHHPGKINLGTVEGVGVDVGATLTDPKDFGVFGARLYRTNAPIGFEHTIAYSPNFLSSDANVIIYNTNLFVQAPLPLIKPYATAGAGLVRAGGDGPGAFGSKFAFNYGGGIKLMMGPIGVRADARGYRIRKVGDSALNVVEASIGIVFGF